MTPQPVAPRGRDRSRCLHSPAVRAMDDAGGWRRNALAVMVPVMATHVVPFAVTASAVPAMAMAMATVNVPAVRAAVPDLNHRAVFLSGERRDPRQGGSGQGHCHRSDHRRADQNDTSHTGFSAPPDRGVSHNSRPGILFLRQTKIDCFDEERGRPGLRRPCVGWSDHVGKNRQK
jgi:hypothetical protein